MRLDRARRNAIVTGAALGCLTVGVLILLGVLGLRPQPPAEPRVEPREAIQAELRTALLDGPDLPAAFSPSPAARPPTQKADAREARCRALIADPAELINISAPSSPAPKRDASTRHVAPDHTTLDQALRVLTNGEAARTYDALLATTRACRDFTAVVDGAPVRVRLDGGKLGLPLIGRSYSVRLTVSSKSSQQTGYLAVGRIGSAISVLRSLGPTTEGQHLEQQVANLLDRALKKILPLGQEAPSRPGGA